MKTILFCILGMLAFTSYNEDSWKPLLDKDLSQWDIYLSYPLKNGYNGEIPVDEKGNPMKPIGYNNNVSNVFSVINEGGPVLRISGEIYGCVFTRQEFENYHLKMNVKFGTKKWEPRLNDPMDSGLLYHSQGECGVDYWRSWMLSQEFQIMENSCGDYWSIANSQIDVKATKTQGSEYYRFDKNGATVSLGTGTGNPGHCERNGNFEKPAGEWNTIELICYGDKSIHIINGHVVMALSHSRFKAGDESKPLTKGKIQLQSEAAEAFYKDIMIKTIEAIPAEYTDLFR